MFFIVALIATIAYAIQGTLMASYYRSMDQLSAVAYRGLSLGLSMLPLLLFVPSVDFGNVPSVAGSILIASVCAALGNLYIARAYCDLPVGIASGMAMSCAALLAGALGFFLLGEVLTPRQIFFSVLVLIAVVVCVENISLCIFSVVSLLSLFKPFDCIRVSELDLAGVDH